MRGSAQDMTITLDTPEVSVQEGEWGEMHVGRETYKTEIDLAPLLKGLPDDACQCPHWGIMLRGRMRVRYAGREEVINAGDAYYMAPGHVPFVEAGSELIEYSPKDAYQETLNVVVANYEALAKQA